jgi:hypothetical protein
VRQDINGKLDFMQLGKYKQGSHSIPATAQPEKMKL